jgi:hypothetical protein
MSTRNLIDLIGIIRVEYGATIFKSICLLAADHF